MANVYQVIYYIAGGEESALNLNDDEDEEDGEELRRMPSSDDLPLDQNYVDLLIEKSLGSVAKNEEEKQTLSKNFSYGAFLDELNE